jgi:hypothetical protein
VFVANIKNCPIEAAACFVLRASQSASQRREEMLFGDKIFGRLMDEFYQTPGQKGVCTQEPKRQREETSLMKLICQADCSHFSGALLKLE